MPKKKTLPDPAAPAEETVTAAESVEETVDAIAEPDMDASTVEPALPEQVMEPEADETGLLPAEGLDASELLPVAPGPSLESAQEDGETAPFSEDMEGDPWIAAGMPEDGHAEEPPLLHSAQPPEEEKLVLGDAADVEDTVTSTEEMSADDLAPAGDIGIERDPAEARTEAPVQRRRRSRRSQMAAEDSERPAAVSDVESPGAQEEHPSSLERNSHSDFYDLDFNALDRDLSPEQRQEWNSIYASYRSRSVLTGSIAGVDRHSVRVRDRRTGEIVRQDMYCATVIPFRVRILIPSTEMWMRGEERPDYVLRNMSGAVIDFVVTYVDREADFAIASRRLALWARRYYFSTQPSLHRSGVRLKCRVLAVGPRRCLVECGGYDIDLTQREMRYTAIPDLREQYHRGDDLDCIVKHYDRENGKLVISVKETNPNPFDGAELRHPVGSRRQAEIAGKYAGGVFCNLPDGVVVMCSYSFQYDDAAFAIGDKVIVMLQRYDSGKKQIYGKIIAKW